MEKYFLVKILKRKNKETGNEYNLAYFVLSSDNSCDLMNILITDEQVNLIKRYEMQNYDFAKHINISWNSYQKKFVPTLVMDNQK